MIKVKLVNYTPKPLETITWAALISYWEEWTTESFEKIGMNDVERHLPRVLGYGHESILEHATFTFAIEGCSRVCTHQLVRHRIASYTQQSQRYQFVSSVKLKEYKLPKPSGEKRNPHCKLSINQEKEIVRWYLEDGLSLWQIAKITGLHPASVLSILRAYGVTPQKAAEVYNGKIVNENFFKDINDPDKAYLLGFIMAAGDIDEAKNALILDKKNFENTLLMEIAERIGRGAKIRAQKDKNIVWIWVGNRKLIEDLKKWGVSEKDKRTLNKVIREITKDLWPHFLRGYLDGNGYIRVIFKDGTFQGVEVTFISPSKKVLEDLALMLSELGLPEGELKYHETQGNWYLRYTKSSSSEDLLRLLYKSVDPLLTRRSNILKALTVVPELRERIKASILRRLEEYEFTIPESVLEDPFLAYKWYDLMRDARELYIESVQAGTPKEDARFILPQAVKTKIVVTMNLRELKHFFGLRLCERAQWEIREVAWKMLEELAKREDIRPIIKWAKLGPRCIQLGYCPERELMPLGCFQRTKEKWNKLLDLTK
ncbi:Thymidylate synthase thyX [Thermococcus chitonophagus]|uniref:Flavin-dependent thymidylate synthase n=1 Tax=Thermococcus chitonophagus TaxID=54262 RepID=A0A160VSY1_9EURY|nr:Thymidylate synthase thyX [Thermococcus chitonophagus]